jgi:hypothetical protein
MALVATVIASVIRGIFKDRADAAEKMFQMSVEVAFNLVNDVAKRTDNKLDDKVALGLQFLHDYYASQGMPEPTPAQIERAKLLFSALNGAGK